MHDPTHLTPEELEQIDHKTMDLAERRQADRKVAGRRRNARKTYEEQSSKAAQADLDYRRTKATQYLEYRAEGETGEGSRIRAEADAADHKKARDIAASLAKAALLKVEETERDSVTIRDVHRTSEKIDGVAPS